MDSTQTFKLKASRLTIGPPQFHCTIIRNFLGDFMYLINSAK